MAHAAVPGLGSCQQGAPLRSFSTQGWEIAVRFAVQHPPVATPLENPREAAVTGQVGASATLS